MSRLRPLIMSIASALSAATQPGCSSGSKAGGSVPLLSAVSPTAQSAKAGASLTLVVTVTDASGKPIADSTVHWAVSVGTGGISPPSNATRGDGTASATAVVGAGQNAFTATVDGASGSPLTFTVTGTVSRLLAVSGSGQSAPAGGALPQPFIVMVADSGGAPVSGIAVTWAVTAGGGSIVPASNTTGSDGTTSATATLGSVAGPNSFTASSPGLDGSPVMFTATGTAFVPTTMALVSGDNQSAAGTIALPLPLVVKVTDAAGHGVGGVAIVWAAGGGGAGITPTSGNTTGDGTAQAIATVPGPRGPATFTATSTGLTGSPVTFHATSLGSFIYTDPPAGGKLRLVKDASSTPTTVALKLVANATMTAYSAGFNLPLDATKVRLNTTPLTPGTALSPGSSPAAAKAVLPATGPLQGVLVTGQSQKRSGVGSVAADSAISAGDVLYTIRLDLAPGSAAGTVFDGSALPAKFSGGVRNLGGTDVVGSADFAIGKLEAQ